MDKDSDTPEENFRYVTLRMVDDRINTYSIEVFGFNWRDKSSNKIMPDKAIRYIFDIIEKQEKEEAEKAKTKSAVKVALIAGFFSLMLPVTVRFFYENWHGIIALFGGK